MGGIDGSCIVCWWFFNYTVFLLKGFIAVKCKACDKILEDFESTKKDKHDNFYDLCGKCLGVSIAATWEVEEESTNGFGKMSQDDWLTLEENYDKIYLSITKEES